MNEITEGNSLEMRNVLSYRGRISQQDMVIITNEMENIIKNAGAKRVGNAVSATFDIAKEHGQVIMDIEILIPLDKAINVPVGYTLKPIFRLTNAVKIRHEGNPSQMQECGHELMAYIQQKQLTPVTAGYTVAVQIPQVPGDLDSFITEMYVGVSDSIL